MNDEIVMYLIFRSDLNLPKGKLAAQAGHAVQLCMRCVEQDGLQQSHLWLDEWETAEYPKVALKVDDLSALVKIEARLLWEQILCTRVIDNGRTVVAPMTVTALAIQPIPKSLVQHITGGLKLL